MLIVYPASWTSTPCATSSATSQSTPQTTPGPDLDRGKRKPLRRCGLDPTKTIEALVGTQGSCNLLTESLTLDQLCGGRAGASSSSCWLSERTPHNDNPQGIFGPNATLDRCRFGEQTPTLPGLFQSKACSLGLGRTATRSGAAHHATKTRFISVAATLLSAL